jgi:hypothetical protein
MNNFRNELNSSEKTSRIILGPDTEAKFTVNDQTADDVLKAEKAAKFNEQVDLMENKLSEHMANIEKQAEELAMDLNGVDIMPMYAYALIKPFEHNPFQRMKVTESGLITDTGGLTPEYKSEEDGRMHAEEELIKVGMVVETGHKCEFLKKGDLVFYNAMASAVTVPFYRLGLVTVNEQRIIAVVNDDLTSRKEALMNYGK